MNYSENIVDYFEKLKSAIDRFDIGEIDKTMNALCAVYENGGKIYVMGNGGSASTASHFANDFNKGLSYDREKKFNVICLNDNISTVMAIANDHGYDKVFSKQLENKVGKGDIVLLISGSGNSANILEAVRYCRSLGENRPLIIGMTGYDGGRLKEQSDLFLHCPENDMQITEDAHLVFNHMMMSVFSRTLKK